LDHYIDHVKAITRPPGVRLAECELTYLDRQPIDIERARAQHRAYESALRHFGVDVQSLPVDDDYPDGCFVEDTAILLGETAVLTRPGAASRRGEIESMASVLGATHDLRRIEAPGTLDGGDVLQADHALYVGVTEGGRTNREGAEALRAIATRAGYDVHIVPFHGCLHLMSAVSYLGDRAVIVDRRFVEPTLFASYRVVDVAPDEPQGANVLDVGDALLVPASAPRTATALRKRRYTVQSVDISEFEKAEGGLTCLSLLVK
jgi:dimethylargininase